MRAEQTAVDQKVWRGDADFYRARLRDAHTYDSLLDMTCHSFVVALEGRPLLSMKNHATYLSTIFAEISLQEALDDMSERIREWIVKGDVALTDEMNYLVETDDIELPFASSSLFHPAL